MVWGGRLLVNVARTSAEVARRSGLSSIDPVRSIGVRAMEAVVPDEVCTVRIGEDLYMRVNPAKDGRWYFFADRDVRWDRGRAGGLRDELTPGDTVVDVGAHLGYFTLLARDTVGPGGTVFAFEPHPDSYARLTENLALNGFEDVVAEQLAVGHASGRLTLYEGDKTIRATTVSALSNGEAVGNVEVVALDTYLQQADARPDLVTINAEGAEDGVLAGLTDTLRSAAPTVIAELHPAHLSALDRAPLDVIETLWAHNYSVDLGSDRSGSVETVCRTATEPFPIIARPPDE